jgi:hypothetical protein
MIDMLKSRLTGKAAISQISYDNVIITEVVFNDNKRQSLNFSFAHRSGIFIISRSPILLQNAIRQIEADSNITAHGNFLNLMRSAGKNASANIYINYSLLPRTMQLFFNTRHRKHSEALSRFADWTELDLNIKNDMLLLNGFTECNDISNQWFETMLSQPAIPVALTDAMPSTVYSFLWLGIRRLEQYFADYGY